MSLEMRINQALTAAHLLERALHAADGWTISYGPHTVPAERRVEDDGVVLTGRFPETCWLFEPSDAIVLSHRDVPLAVRPLGHPGDGGFDIDWSLRLPAVEPAL